MLYKIFSFFMRICCISSVFSPSLGGYIGNTTTKKKTIFSHVVCGVQVNFYKSLCVLRQNYLCIIGSVLNLCRVINCLSVLINLLCKLHCILRLTIYQINFFNRHFKLCEKSLLLFYKLYKLIEYVKFVFLFPFL